MIIKAYFLNWILLKIPPHLHTCMEQLPLSRMTSLVDTLFQDPTKFFNNWDNYEADVIAAVEMVSIASYATTDSIGVDADLWSSTSHRLSNWKTFIDSAVRISLTTLASPAVHQKSRDKFHESK